MTWTEYTVEGVPHRYDEQADRLQVWTQTDAFAGWVDVPGRGAQPPSRQEATTLTPVTPELPGTASLPVQTVHTIKETSRDRAHAFVIKTRWLAGVAAVAIGSIAYLAGAPALWSIVAVFVVYALVWLVAHWQHLRASPESTQRYAVRRQMDILDRHSRDASDLFRKQNGLDR